MALPHSGACGFEGLVADLLSAVTGLSFATQKSGSQRGTDALASTFGASAGAEELPGSFGAVDWRPYRDRLDCSDPDDVIDYLASTPPVEDASEAEQTRIVDAVRARFAAGGGRLRVSKDTGLFLCRQPRPPA